MAAKCYNSLDTNFTILSSNVDVTKIPDKLPCHDVLFVTIVRFCRENILHFDEFFLSKFCCARQISFPFPTCLKHKKNSWNWRVLSLKTSIWRVFQFFVARAQFHFKLSQKFEKNCQFYNILRASDFISSYFN